MTTLASSSAKVHNIWDDRLPTEIKDAIFAETDILTRYLNGLLTEDDIENNATEIYCEAFRQDWDGDLSLLPQDQGFPKMDEDGLLLIRSRSMYQRVCQIQPDLSIDNPKMKQRFDVFCLDHPRYGYFVGRGAEVQFLVDKEDEYILDSLDPNTTLFRDGWSPYINNPIESMKPCLLQIALRNCWIDLLEPWISMNPRNMALMALGLRHLDLLVYLVDTVKLVDLAAELRYDYARFVVPWGDIAKYGDIP
ncbi:hypothetical protein HDU76_001503, partial [Blyttiomyces sp. JEL0837]